MNTPSEQFPDRTMALVISALGGEGGGVLAGWIVSSPRAVTGLVHTGI